MRADATKITCKRQLRGAQLCGSLSGPLRLARLDHPLRHVPGAAGAARLTPQTGRTAGSEGT